MKTPSLIAFFTLCVTAVVAGPAVLLKDDFDRTGLGKGWSIENGK